MSIDVDNYPLQWPKNFPEMKHIDNLLRCGVCFEVIETAMMIQQCSHNYCSLCIRRHMTYKTECPTCRVTAVNSDLKNNRILDDLIKHFTSIRNSLVKILVKLDTDSDGPDSATSSRPIKNNHQSVKKAIRAQKHKSTETLLVQDEESEIFESAFRKEKNKRKYLDIKSPEQKKVVEDQSSKSSLLELTSPEVKGPRRSKRARKCGRCSPCQIKVNCGKCTNCMNKGFKQACKLRKCQFLHKPVHEESSDCIESKLPPHSENDPLILPSSAEKKIVVSEKLLKCPDQLESFPPSTSCIRNSAEDNIAPSIRNKNDRVTAKPLTPTPANTVRKVSCPVCALQISERFMNLHLDKCLSSDEDRNIFLPKPKRKPMPKLVYNLLPDKVLKKKLVEVGLSNQGSRHVLIKRHQEFTLQYNSQCDSLNPKSAQELVKEFEATERKKSQMSFLNMRMNTTIKSDQVVKINRTYLKEHREQFQFLIADVKKRMKKWAESQKTKQFAVVPNEDANKSKLNNSSAECSEVLGINEKNLHPINSNPDKTKMNIVPSVEKSDDQLNINKGKTLPVDIDSDTKSLDNLADPLSSLSANVSDEVMLYTSSCVQASVLDCASYNAMTTADDESVELLDITSNQAHSAVSKNISSNIEENTPKSRYSLSTVEMSEVSDNDLFESTDCSNYIKKKRKRNSSETVSNAN